MSALRAATSVLPVVGAVLVATAAAGAAGFDVNAEQGGAHVAASGSADARPCADEVQLAPEWRLVEDPTQPTPRWVLDAVRVSGPGDLAATCEGAELTLAVAGPAGAVSVGPLPVRHGEPLPRFVLDVPVDRDLVTSLDVLVVPGSTVVRLTEVAP